MLNEFLRIFNSYIMSISKINYYYEDFMYVDLYYSDNKTEIY